jgi:hypothetical protein
MELKTELAIHYLHSFVAFASRRLGSDVRFWLFVPREELGHSEPATVLREGRVHEVIELLVRQDGDDQAVRSQDEAVRPRRSTLFRGRQGPRRLRLRAPRQPPPSLEELDRRLAGKRLDLEGVIYGAL